MRWLSVWAQAGFLSKNYRWVMKGERERKKMRLCAIWGILKCHCDVLVADNYSVVGVVYSQITPPTSAWPSECFKKMMWMIWLWSSPSPRSERWLWLWSDLVEGALELSDVSENINIVMSLLQYSLDRKQMIALVLSLIFKMCVCNSQKCIQKLL